MQVVIRVLGFLGLILCIIPFQFKKHKEIVLCKMVSELFFSVQYFLLGAYTGAWIDLISGLRNYLFYLFVEKKRSTTPVILIFGMLVIALGVSTWDGPISLFPMIAKLLTTVSYGMKNERLLRMITLPSCFFWVIYNCLIGTWEAALADSLALASILIAMYKFDIKDQSVNKKFEV